MKRNSGLLLVLLLIFSMLSCTNVDEQVRKEIKQGLKLMYIGRQTEAIVHFEKALDLDSTQAEAYLYLGRTYYNQGKYEKAMYEINRSIHFAPDYGEAFRSRGLLWKALGNQDRFCEDYLKAEDLGVKNLTNYTSKCRDAHRFK